MEVVKDGKVIHYVLGWVEEDFPQNLFGYDELKERVVPQQKLVMAYHDALVRGYLLKETKSETVIPPSDELRKKHDVISTGIVRVMSKEIIFSSLDGFRPHNLLFRTFTPINRSEACSLKSDEPFSALYLFGRTEEDVRGTAREELRLPLS